CCLLSAGGPCAHPGAPGSPGPRAHGGGGETQAQAAGGLGTAQDHSKGQRPEGRTSTVRLAGPIAVRLQSNDAENGGKSAHSPLGGATLCISYAKRFGGKASPLIIINCTNQTKLPGNANIYTSLHRLHSLTVRHKRPSLAVVHRQTRTLETKR
ncbi:hypothetical protein ANANG_G00310950, partial [Anguilla anguilla]